MRYLVFVLSLIIILSGCVGGMTPLSPAEKRVRAVAEIPVVRDDQAFRITQDWMNRTFTSSGEPVRFADREAGNLTAVGQIDYPCRWFECMTKGDWRVVFQMNVMLKPGQIETVFRDLELRSAPSAKNFSSDGMRSPVWSRRDMDAIRPLLLQLHNQLVKRLQ